MQKLTVMVGNIESADPKLLPASNTLMETLALYEAAGYIETFRADETGLIATSTGTKYEPEALEVDAYARFEGVSNPDEMSILFAIHSPNDDVRGTYTAGFGPSADPIDSDMMNRLRVIS